MCWLRVFEAGGLVDLSYRMQLGIEEWESSCD